MYLRFFSFLLKINIIDYGMTPEDAVNKPKFHHQWLPDEVYVEKTFDAATKAGLEKMGYTIKERAAIGRVEVIKVVNNQLQAAADKRGDDSAAGW